MNKKPAAPPIIVFPLFGQKGDKGLTSEQLVAEKKAQRKLIRSHSGNPGVRAMFNMVERVAARLQRDGTAPGATSHDAGQAYGAGYVAQILRTVLEGVDEEEGED